MFGFLGKANPERQAVKELKKLRKEIMKNGGPEIVCYSFWKHLESDPLYNQAGLVAEEDAPYPKMMAILSSLDLLNSWKKTPDDNPSIKELMELLSKRVYIAGFLTLNHSELSELHQSIGATRGEMILDAIRANELEQKLLTEIQQRKAKAEDAWNKWRETDFDVFEAIKNA